MLINKVNCLPFYFTEQKVSHEVERSLTLWGSENRIKNYITTGEERLLYVED